MGVFGQGLKADKEMQALSAFYYGLLEAGETLRVETDDQIPFVALSDYEEVEGDEVRLTPGRRNEEGEGEEAPPAQPPAQQTKAPENLLELTRRFDVLSEGRDPASAAARLFMLFFNGNYFFLGERLHWVSLPVEPTAGHWNDIAKAPQCLHPLPKDYALCATISLEYCLAGFLWPTFQVVLAGMGAGDAEAVRAEVSRIIERLWVALVLKAFYLVAAPDCLPGHTALTYAAGTYARLAALEGWLNPLVMREELRTILERCAGRLWAYRSIVEDLEQALRSGLVEDHRDFLVRCEGVVDGRLEEEDARFGVLMRYQRERAESLVGMQKAAASAGTVG